MEQDKSHEAIAQRGAEAVIPPRKNAPLWKSQSAGGKGAQRNDAGLQAPGASDLEDVEWLSSAQPGGDQDALLQTDMACTENSVCHPVARHGRLRLQCPPSRSIAQSGSASGLGPEGREFESLCSDQFFLSALSQFRRDVVQCQAQRCRQIWT